MTYAELAAQIQQYLQNDETAFVAQIPTFVRLAERKIYDEVNLPIKRKNVTATVTSANPSIGVPSDFNSIYEIFIIIPGTGAQYLINKDVSFIREMYPLAATAGVPQYYAMMDHQNIILGPTPDSNYSVEMHYFGYPASIVTASTTWLGDRFENALLFGSLLQGYANMKGDTEVFAIYQKAYDEAMMQVKAFAAGQSSNDWYRGDASRP
jgi:hypothetical protein